MGTTTRHAEVIGAGIGGLTAATALARRGWSVRLHEREDGVRATGSGIYLWDNGLAVLEEFGVIDQALHGAHYGPAFELRDKHNNTVGRAPVNGDTGMRVVTIERERLIDSLVAATTAAGVEIVTKSSVVGVDPAGSVEFENCSRAEADLVVVANGVRSRLRDQLGLIRRRRALGQSCARLLVRREPGMVPDSWKDDYVEFFSGRRYLLYTPCSADLLYFALVAPSSDREAIGDPLPTATWIRSFPHLEALITAAGQEPIARWDDFERVELQRWSEGKIAVLGDAAHAQPPYLGQGGGCAMAAATGLAASVAEPGNLAQQLADWETLNRPLIEHTQRFAHAVGRMNDIPDVARTVLQRALGRSQKFGMSRLRAAKSTPRGLSPRRGASY